MASISIFSSTFGNQSEKFYVNLDSVIFESTGIYVNTEGTLQKVEAIAFDENEDCYYAVKELGNKWKCGNCGKYNDPENNNCWYCGWPWGPP